MKKLVWLLVVIAVGGLGYWRYASRPDPQLKLRVVLAIVGRGNVADSVRATGRLEAVSTVQVGSQISGTIKSLSADFNSYVRRGQIIAELEPSLLQAQVEQAQATLDRLIAEVERSRVLLDDADAKLKRAQELSAKQLISANDLETAEATTLGARSSVQAANAQVAQARAALNQAQVNLSHTVVTAPIDGVVISRNVDVGQTVAASMQAPTLFQLAHDLSRMQVTVSIDESDVGRVQKGQEVSFQVDAFPNETFRGIVRQVRLNPSIESNVVSYITMVDVPNPELRLRPGMTANVTVEVERASNALRVPLAALRFEPSAAILAAFVRPETRGATASAATVAEPPKLDVDEAAGSAFAAGAPGRVWRLADDGWLEAVQVRTGINDGVNVAVLVGDLRVGTGVVTGVVEDAAPAAAGGPLRRLLQRRRGVAGAGADQPSGLRTGSVEGESRGR